ncbi:MAG TPA: DUF4157 domain-containing protein [Puia sp.]|nr:DUF4157 domain-containing protein [Puia sp.]
MSLRRKKIRRQLEEPGKRSFFSKPAAEEKAPFFQGGAIQRKLDIGHSNDPQEKEADSAAKQVTGQQVQRAEKKEEEKPVQKADKKKEEEKPVQKADKKEEEKPVQKADKKEEEKPVQKAEKKEEEKPVQKAEKKEEEKPVQKAEKKEEEKPVQKMEKKEDEQPGPVQRSEKKDAVAAGPGTSALEKLLARRKGMGFSLPDEVRVEMERKFHSSFREVRVHTDKEAQDICESIHALAFAHGYDIYFNQGQYNPNSNVGRELLAHELAHVVQQNG